MSLRMLAGAALLATGAAASPAHFQQWFPQYGPTFERFIRGSCKTTFAEYMADYAPTCDYVGCLSGRVVHCLLSSATESLKANMAAAAVLLGLLPTTLSLVGSNTVETGVLALRRPLLAALLAAGMPSVAPIRLFDYDDPAELLLGRPPPAGLRVPAPTHAGVLAAAALAEYLLAAAAVANLGHLSYLLCVRAVCSFSSDTAFHPALWAFLALAMHVWGAATVRLRLRILDPEDLVVVVGGGAPQKPPSRLPSDGSWSDPSGLVRTGTSGCLAGFWHGLSRLAAAEFQPSFWGRGEIVVVEKERSNLFIITNWASSIFTVLHIIYGTLIFSSLLFISTADAVKVVARFLASTVACRITLVFEISGMQKRARIK